MSNRRHNPERRTWKDRSHKKGGARVRDLRDAPEGGTTPALSYGPYKLFGYPRKPSYALLADAAQEAEFLHAEHGYTVQVQDEHGDFVYTSKGGPA